MSKINIDDKLFGSPISGKVREELEKRQNRAKNSDDVYAPVSDKTKGYNLNERTPFVRMWTSLKLIEPGQDKGVIEEFPISKYKDAFKTASERAMKILEERQDNSSGDDIPTGVDVITKYDKDNSILGYQIFDQTVRDQVDIERKTYIVGDYNYSKNYGQVGDDILSSTRSTPFINVDPYISEILPDELMDNQTLKPLAGITSVTSETMEFLGAQKQTTVRFVVHNFHDFDRIYNRYFLKPGAKIFVDFGWSSLKNLYNPDDLISSKKIKEFLYNTVETPGYEGVEGQTQNGSGELGVVTEAAGELEVICGVVTDYKSKILSNGSVECEVTLQSANSALLDLSITEDVKELLSKQIRFGIPYLGALPFLQEYEEDGKEIAENVFKTLFIPSPKDPKNFDTFDSLVNSINRAELSNQGTFTPIGNSVRTGIFVPNVLDQTDVYLSWGFIEDVIINEKFGFGRDNTEIITGDDFNVRIDSSKQFTTFTKSRLKKQSAFKEFDDSPMFVYPEFWGDNCDSAEGDDSGGDYGAGSFSFQQGKYPINHYPDNLSTPQSTYDKGLKRIPIREVFIHTDVILNTLTLDSEDEGKLNVKKMLKLMLEEINGKEDFPLFNWSLTSNQLGTELKVVDNNLTDSLRRLRTSGFVGEEGATSAGEAELLKQTEFFRDLFTFNIMSPSSIVKEYNLEFNLPSGDIGNMYAIQGMSHEDQVIPVNDILDRNFMINGMDKDSKSIIYEPDHGSHRIERIAGDKNEVSTDFKARHSVQSLLSTNVYNPTVDVSNLTYMDDVKLQSTQEGSVLGTSELYNSTQIDYTKAAGKKWGATAKVLAVHKNMIIAEGNRVAENLLQYDEKTEQIEQEVTILDRANLLPFTLTLTIYGISTLQPGDVFKVDYLPEIYKSNAMLQTMKIIHNINSDGWFTTLETQFRPLPDVSKSYYVNIESQAIPYLSPTYLYGQYANNSGMRLVQGDILPFDDMYQITHGGGAVVGRVYTRDINHDSVNDIGKFNNIKSHKSNGKLWGNHLYVEPETLYPYFHKITPVEIPKGTFKNIEAIFEFEVTDILDNHRKSISKNRDFEQIGLMLYNPLIQKKHNYSDPQNFNQAYDIDVGFAAERNDCMIDINGFFYVPMPVVLQNIVGVEGNQRRYHLVMYNSNVHYQSFVYDTLLAPDNMGLLEALKFWDSGLYAENELFKGERAKVKGKERNEVEVVDKDSGAHFTFDMNTGGGLVYYYRAVKNNENRALRRDEVERVFNQYMKEGNVGAAHQYAQNEGFPSIISSKSLNPSDYDDSDDNNINDNNYDSQYVPGKKFHN